MHAEKQWHYCGKKNKTNCVVTRRAILNPLLTKWVISGGQLYLLLHIKTLSLMQNPGENPLFWPRRHLQQCTRGRRQLQQCPRGCPWAKKQKPNLNLRHSLSYSIGTRMIHLSKKFLRNRASLDEFKRNLKSRTS